MKKRLICLVSIFLFLGFTTGAFAGAPFDTAVFSAATGVVDIPGVEVDGLHYHVQLQLNGRGEFEISSMVLTDHSAGTADDTDPAFVGDLALGAFFDGTSGKVFLPFVSVDGSLYWVVLELASANPLTLRVAALGPALFADTPDQLSSEDGACIGALDYIKENQNSGSLSMTSDLLATITASSSPYCQATHSLAAFFGVSVYGEGSNPIERNSTLAWELARQSAAAGNSYGQYVLAFLYAQDTDNITSADSGYSHLWNSISAAQGNSWGENSVGVDYVYGSYVKRKAGTAYYYYSLASAQDNKLAQKNLAILCIELGLLDQATSLLTGLTLGGDSEAMYYMAQIEYMNQAYDKAFDWAEMSAERANPAGQSLLSDFYYYGIGVSVDDGQAFYWAQQSAQLGYPVGQRQLGLYYYYGVGVDADVAESNAWYEKAALQGDSYSQTALGDYYCFDIENYQQALYWYELAVQAGNPYAQNNLGWMYTEALGVTPDYAYAIQLYTLSYQALGLAETAWNMGYAYEKQGNTVSACEWYNVALAADPQNQIYIESAAGCQ